MKILIIQLLNVYMEFNLIIASTTRAAHNTHTVSMKISHLLKPYFFPTFSSDFFHPMILVNGMTL